MRIYRGASLSARIGLALMTAVACGCAQETDPAVLFEQGAYEESFRRFSDLAADGDIIAINYVGMHYYMGAGVERDFATAFKWFERAALAGHPGAQRNLGVMYLRGFGVERDNHQAYGWLYYAREGGNEGANDYLELISDNVTPNAAGVARKRVKQRLVTAARAAATD